MLKNKLQILLTGVMAAILLLGSCQKMKRPALGDYPKDSNPPGGPLKFYVAFDGNSADPLRNAVDSVRANFASENPFKIIRGISGNAAEGVAGKAIKYATANDFASSTSFSLSMWMKGSPPPAGGPQFLFSLPSKDYWHGSALFMLIEDQGQSTTSQAAVKIAVQDQWFEFVGANRMPGNLLNGNWHHFVITYDQTTSKMTYYIDGTALTGLPSNLTDVKNGGNPRGPLSFNNVSNFIIGGWNKHAGVSGPGDGWINSFTGGIDQFRLYSKPLTASEVTALFNSKL